jgi:hypothetical protein
VDLPTYTNIWRIEKRLYESYDFQPPVPLPINWIAVCAGIMVSSIVLLIVTRPPFTPHPGLTVSTSLRGLVLADHQAQVSQS